jgi:hypothetical protein
MEADMTSPMTPTAEELFAEVQELHARIKRLEQQRGKLIGQRFDLISALRWLFDTGVLDCPKGERAAAAVKAAREAMRPKVTP